MRRFFGLLQIYKDVIDTRHAAKVGLISKLGVDRHQIVDASELHGVAAVIEQRHVGLARGASEFDGGVLHLGLVEIDADDGLEADAFQRSYHVLGIVARIGKLGGIGIGAIANDQRNALLGERRRGPCDERDGRGEQQSHAVHCSPPQEAGPDGRQLSREILHWPS